MANDIEPLFTFLLAICISLEKYLFQSFAYFSTGLHVFLLSYKCSLYILDTIRLLDTRLHIFTPNLNTVFALSWWHPLKHKKFLLWLSSAHAYFSFVSHAFGVISKKPLPHPRLQRFLPVLSSNSLVVLIITSMSWFYFNFCICCVVRGSNFILLHVNI